MRHYFKGILYQLAMRLFKAYVCRTLPALLMAGAVFLLFARSASFSYIGIDDAAYTFRNPFVAPGLTLDGIVEAFSNFRHGGIWMPVTYIMYMIDFSVCKLFGFQLMATMHVVNVLLHAVNFLFLVRLMRRLVLGCGNGENRICDLRLKCGAQSGGGAAAYQLPTANYQSPIVNRKSINHKCHLWWLLAMLFCVLACLSKPTAMCFPFLAMLVEWLVVRSRNSEATLCDGEGTIATPASHRTTTSYPLPTIYCHLPTTIYPLPSIHYQLLLLLPALVWALHPLRVEPVAWIAARKELLWTTFTLLGLLCWTNMLYRRPQITNSESGDSKSPVLRWPIVNRLLPYLPMLVVAGATAAIAAYSQTHVAGQGCTSLYAAPFGHRIVNALSAIGFYLRTIFWPVGLHIDCRAVKSLMPLDGVANIAALAGVCLGFAIYGLLRLRSMIVAVRSESGDAASASHAERNCAPQFSRDGEGAVATSASRTIANIKSQIGKPTNYQPPILNRKSNNRKFLFFSFLWFMIGLLPTLGIFGGFGIESHADRFAYLPMIGFSFLLAAWLVDLARRDGNVRRLRAVKWILAIVVVLLAVTSFRQLGFWKDDAEAYGRALACDSGHPRAMVHVADALCSRRRNFDAGIAMYRKALSFADTVPEGGFNVGDVRARLAYALASRGGYDDFDEVKRLGADVLRNIRLDRRGMMLDALGTAFMNEGDLKRAAVLFQASIDAPDRFWPKASTKRKLEMCR